MRIYHFSVDSPVQTGTYAILIVNVRPNLTRSPFLIRGIRIDVGIRGHEPVARGDLIAVLVGELEFGGF